MCLSPWSAFEHRTVNEPLVMLRLQMNGIKNVLSCAEVQRPAKATSIHSLMINLNASLHMSLNHQPLCPAPQKCQSVHLQTHALALE